MWASTNPTLSFLADKEVLLLHFLPGFIVGGWSCLMTCTRNLSRGDTLLGVLGCVCICSKFVQVLFLSHISYIIRMSQKLAELEIRRVEADVRTVTPGLIHRITPRFKSLLVSPPPTPPLAQNLEGDVNEPLCEQTRPHERVCAPYPPY